MGDEELSYFLKNNAPEIIGISEVQDPDDPRSKFYNNSIEFVDELYEQWQNKTGGSTNRVRYKEKVFLSYSWDDKPLVERLKNEFEKNGVTVFFDDDELKTGDKFNQVIRKNIKECKYFIPIISRNAIEDQSRYVYAKEWNAAIVLNDFSEDPKSPVICPFIIDDTQPTDSRIPEYIRKDIDIETLPDTDHYNEVVRRFIREQNLSVIED